MFFNKKLIKIIFCLYFIIIFCIQGQLQSEHFGFICREGQNSQTYIGYIFKCESRSVASDAVSGNNSLYTYIFFILMIF